ncbi:MAG: cell division protein ZapE [Betaproteobacteria bacterium HGW-Betaproteobacteria-13]|uniref:Cell division protein ZapE n=1 Tax=Parazoarcus communis TaxID=41977 RepID=A0A2U8H3Z1_9RHOO|nr:cell division protein ZapE [Parazoarcus communis]AWI80424.1 cell division protein ZapE [Parazoarcus communis]PKO79332.1 MAG: cell division protein ZapE [Betaproteobacteria bacterium HGW-Betaproteobacteria-13]
MPHRTLNVPERGMLDAYDAQLKARGYKSDPAQRAAVQRLQQLYTELVTFKAARRTALRKVFARPRMPRSVYFWGGVGRGKSFLMDCFYDSVPYQRKRRVHFHAFMQEVQNDLKDHNQEADPLQKVADRIARQTRLLCFDEFHVSDIADAMILGRLLDALFARGVIFVMTSNYPPEGLYPNGLMRVNFLPTIEMMKRRFDVIEVDHGTDYRLRTLEKIEIYLVPADEAANQKMRDDFKRLAATDVVPGEIEVIGRSLPVLGCAVGVIWFDFATLCRGNRSQNDYLEIAREHHTLLLSGVPRMRGGEASEARRLTWLIDVLYDHRVKLIMSAEVEAHDLYTEGHNAHEFVRTVSRLMEMRTRDYLAEPHRVE